MHRLFTLVLISLSLIFCSCENSGKDFSEQFKTDWLSSCQKQIRGNMDRATAQQYCQCSLDIVLERYNNDAQAKEAIAAMPVSKMQKVLVMPCIQ